MRQILLFFTILAFLCACNKEPQTDGIDYQNLIVGEWVYDNPNEGEWEQIKFTSSGMFYFSNRSKYPIEFTNENINGRYFLNNEKGQISGSYSLNGIQMTLDFQILTINKFAFKAKFIDSGITFTYARLLDTKNVNYQETITPNYSSLVGGAQILGYASHNTKIATVNTSTGEISGGSAGTTYIDVSTSEGIAVVAVTVNGLLPYNFDEYIGVKRAKIYQTFGSAILIDNDSEIWYKNFNSEIEYLVISFDLWTEKVNRISLILSNKSTTYQNSITSYLNNLYYVYGSHTLIEKDYINNSQFINATAGISWYLNDNMIDYIAINHDLFTDYSPFLGKTQSQVRTLMGTKNPIRSSAQMLDYAIQDGKIDYVAFIYAYDYITTYEATQYVEVALNSILKPVDIESFLAKKYSYMPSRNYEGYKCYKSHDSLLYIEYEEEYNTVYYYSNIEGIKSRVNSKNINKLIKESKIRP